MGKNIDEDVVVITSMLVDESRKGTFLCDRRDAGSAGDGHESELIASTLFVHGRIPAIGHHSTVISKVGFRELARLPL